MVLAKAPKRYKHEIVVRASWEAAADQGFLRNVLDQRRQVVRLEIVR